MSQEREGRRKTAGAGRSGGGCGEAGAAEPHNNTHPEDRGSKGGRRGNTMEWHENCVKDKTNSSLLIPFTYD
jgi:hypothetical protein